MTLNDIEKQLQEIITKNDTQQKELQAQIDDYTEQIKDLEEKKQAAFEDFNADKYEEISRRIETLEKFKASKIEMLEAFKNKPLINKDVYNEMKTAILNITDKAQEETTAKAIQLAEEMTEESNKLDSIYKQAGALCTTLQVKLYKNQDRQIISKEGKTPIIYATGSELAPKRNGVIEYLAEPSKAGFYKNNGGQLTATINQPARTLTNLANRSAGVKLDKVPENAPKATNPNITPQQGKPESAITEKSLKATLETMYNTPIKVRE